MNKEKSVILSSTNLTLLYCYHVNQVGKELMKVGKIYVLFAGGEVRGQSFSLYGPVNNLIIFFSNDSQTKKITEKNSRKRFCDRQGQENPDRAKS